MAGRVVRGCQKHEEFSGNLFPGRDHYTCGEPGWEAVADFALDWALAPKAGIFDSGDGAAYPSSSAAGRRPRTQATGGASGRSRWPGR